MACNCTKRKNLTTQPKKVSQTQVRKPVGRSGSLRKIYRRNAY